MFDADTLHDLEKKVLLVLKEVGEAVSNNVILSKSGLGESEVNRAIEWLREKQLIVTEEQLKQKFKLTELGEKCAKEGMPEKIFLNTIKDKPLTFPELKAKSGLDNNGFNVSIGFLKKENMIDVIDGKINVTDAGLKRLKLHWPEDELFPILKEWTYFDELPPHLKEPMPFLKDRGLVVEKTTSIKTIYLTDVGKSILPKIKIEDRLDLLTPQVIIDKSWKNKKFRKYEISLPSPPIHLGKKQPYLHFVDELKNKLAGFGFEEMKGPYVELSFFNNDILFMPQDHPAREIHDVFSLKYPKTGDLKKYEKILAKVKDVHETGGKTGSIGWGYKFDSVKSTQLLLRSQTTAVSARTMISPDLKIPGKYFTIDRNFRVDVIDWKHLAEFDQVEGIILDSKMTFRELLGILKMFAIEVGGAKKIKFAPSYFPFTEPSVELHAWIEGKGWVEIGGAGILRPEVTEPLGIKVPVIAWGLGILRLFMTRYNVKDMRQVFSDDLKWIREFRW